MSEDNIDIMTKKESHYDEILLSMLQNEGKIQPFIDQIFRFLYRRTDFYLVQEKADQPYGFPLGVSENIVRKAFQKYDSYSKEKLKKKLLGSSENISTPVPSSTKLNENPIEIVKNSDKKELQKLEEINKEFLNTDTGSNKEKLKKQQEIFQKNPESYNGAMREKYSWTQTIKDVDIKINIDPKIKTSKDVKIKIEKELLQVTVKTEYGSMVDIINDKLAWKVRPDECTWSLFPGDHISIYLEKVDERWWENLISSEEKIDLSNMNPEKPMEDLDQECQAKIKQMMFDEHQKKLGLETSDQIKKNEILKKAWNCEGSPFKGQPFDPSLVMHANK